MQMCHRPVLDSCHRQIERHLSTVLQYLYVTMTGRPKKRQARSDSDCLQYWRAAIKTISSFTIYVRAQEYKQTRRFCFSRKNGHHENAMCVTILREALIVLNTGSRDAHTNCFHGTFLNWNLNYGWTSHIYIYMARWTLKG